MDLFQDMADRKSIANEGVKEIAELKNISYDQAKELVLERYAKNMASDIRRLEKLLTDL